MKFWQKKQTTVNDIVKWLEYIFQKMDLILSDHEPEDPNDKTWGITLPDQIQFIIHIDETDSDIIIFELYSILCEIPQQNILPFYRKCLELNLILCGGTIIINETQVCFVQKRSIDDIAEEELSNMITYHLNVSTGLLNDLSEEFDIIKIND